MEHPSARQDRPAAFPPSASAAWACPACTARPTARRASPRSMPRSTPASTLIDTGDFYGMGHNETADRRGAEGRAARQLSAQREVRRACAIRPAAGSAIDARPAAVKNFLAYSLQRLGVDHIDIYRPARLDPNVPIEDTVGAIADMVKAGYVRHIGLSEVGAATIRRAAAVHPIVDLQIEYSLISRGIEDDILATRELGIGITAYGVLSRGLIGGS